jgi:hypothetical protein
MNHASDEHISLVTLWASRMHELQLSSDESEDVLGCPECLRLLGLCETSQTIQQAARRQEEQMRETDA